MQYDIRFSRQQHGKNRSIRFYPVLGDDTDNILFPFGKERVDAIDKSKQFPVGICYALNNESISIRITPGTPDNILQYIHPNHKKIVIQLTRFKFIQNLSQYSIK